MLQEPIHDIQISDVSNLGDLHAKSLHEIDTVKYKQPSTAYSMFFRDERRKLLHLPAQSSDGIIHTARSKRKFSFQQMAHTVSTNWKASSADEKRYYEILAEEEARRQSGQEQSTLSSSLFRNVLQQQHQQHHHQQQQQQQHHHQQQQQQQQQQKPQFPDLKIIIDLPTIVDEVFDDAQSLEGADPILEFEQMVAQQRPSPKVVAVPVKKTRSTTQVEQGNKEHFAFDTSSEVTRARVTDYQCTLEKSFDVMPSLLGDIPDDAPWPF